MSRSGKIVAAVSLAVTLTLFVGLTVGILRFSGVGAQQGKFSDLLTAPCAVLAKAGLPPALPTPTLRESGGGMAPVDFPAASGGYTTCTAESGTITHALTVEATFTKMGPAPDGWFTIGGPEHADKTVEFLRAEQSSTQHIQPVPALGSGAWASRDTVTFAVSNLVVETRWNGPTPPDPAAMLSLATALQATLNA